MLIDGDLNNVINKITSCNVLYKQNAVQPLFLSVNNIFIIDTQKKPLTHTSDPVNAR